MIVAVTIYLLLIMTYQVVRGLWNCVGLGYRGKRVVFFDLRGF
jgi:hypothetical protein